MNKLSWRLALSFLLVILLVIAAVALIVRGTVSSSFNQYVNFSDKARFGDELLAQIEAHYAENGTWTGVESLLPERIGGGGGSGDGRGQGAGPGSSDGRGVQAFIADAAGVIVAATVREWIGETIDSIGPSRRVALSVGGEVIGALGEQTPATVALNEAEMRFLEDISSGLLVTGLVAGLLAFCLGIALSISLTRPLQRLTDHIGGWALRQNPQPLHVGGTDEIRRLAEAFNNLMARLSAGEAQRQRMSADIAHELRTPVTVMRGHLEAMMDGVYPLDAAHLAVAYDQTLHLARLVEDLRLLTQAEAGRLPLSRCDLDLAVVARDAAARFAPLAQDADITLTAHLSNTPVRVHADPHRLQQVMDNLLSNAVRHTPSGGQMALRVTTSGSWAQVTIYNDTTTPLSEDQVAQLFDRFWRGTDARERDRGGSGLGLAITRELLRLHGGDIHAVREGQGLALIFRLPVADDPTTVISRGEWPT